MSKRVSGIPLTCGNISSHYSRWRCTSHAPMPRSQARSIAPRRGHAYLHEYALSVALATSEDPQRGPGKRAPADSSCLAIAFSNRERCPLPGIRGCGRPGVAPSPRSLSE